MKKKCDALVEKLACKDLTAGCEIQLLADGYIPNINADSWSVSIYRTIEAHISFVDGDVFGVECLCFHPTGNLQRSFKASKKTLSCIKHRVIGHPITLQTVLMREEVLNIPLNIHREDVVYTIFDLWQKCGDKSLQEIIAESGHCQADNLPLDKKEEYKTWAVLCNKDAQNLINYLLTIFR